MAARLETLDQYAGPVLPPFPLDTLPKIFFDTVDKRPRPDAVRYKRDGHWHAISTAEVARQVAAFATALEGLGVEPGDRVAVLSENRPEWLVGDYATLGLGAIYVPIYSTLPANQITFLLANSEAKVLLVSGCEQYDKFAEIEQEVPSVRHVISFDDVGVPKVLKFTDLVDEGARKPGYEQEFRKRALQVDPGEVATLIYTSGTTASPKGAMLTHRNLASNVAAIDRHDILDPEAGDVGLSFLPLSHVFERLVDYYFLRAGVCIAYAESIEKVAENLLEVRPSYFVSVPRLFEKIYAKVMGAGGVKKLIVNWAKKVGEEVATLQLARQPIPGGLQARYRIADRLVFSKLRERTGGRLRLAISGGAPLSKEIALFFYAAGLPVYEGYGLTETSPVISANKPGNVKLGTVGLPVAGTEIRIGSNGEILVRGPQVMKGYWRRDDATAECIEPDGWFHTGDVGMIDEDGFLTITDRIKNIIVTAGGKNITPQPIENAVALSPYVAQAVMLGDRRAYPTLLIAPDFEHLRAWAKGQGINVRDDQALVSDPRVRAFMENEVFGRLEGLARHETPKKIGLLPRELTVDTGELTPSLKVKRRVLEERYSDVIEGMYQG